MPAHTRSCQSSSSSHGRRRQEIDLLAGAKRLLFRVERIFNSFVLVMPVLKGVLKGFRR